MTLSHSILPGSLGDAICDKGAYNGVVERKIDCYFTGPIIVNLIDIAEVSCSEIFIDQADGSSSR